jgi:hypothetical protein
MGRGARVLIARRSMPRSGWRGTARLCPVCGLRRTAKEFQKRSYGGKGTQEVRAAWLRSKGVGRGSRTRGRYKGGSRRQRVAIGARFEA